MAKNHVADDTGLADGTEPNRPDTAAQFPAATATETSDEAPLDELARTNSAAIESTIAQNEVQAASEATAETPKTKAPRRMTTVDPEGGKVTYHALGDKAEETYSFDDLPDNAKRYASIVGMRTMLNQGETPAAAYEKLKKGELPAERTTTANGEPKVNPWRLAIAAALVERHAKSGVVLTHEAAMEKANALNRADFAKLKGDPTVTKHYSMIAGEQEASGLDSI